MASVPIFLVIWTVIGCCYCLEPATEPLKVYTVENCKNSWIFNSDLNGLSLANNLDPNTYDTISYCSQYELNTELANSVKHCVDQPETCGGDVQITSELKTKLGEISEFVKNFPRSCKDIALTANSSAKTGYHLILAPNNSFIEVYCNFDLNFGGGSGWMKLMDLDMSKPDAVCPDGLFSYYFPGLTYPLCDREHFVGGHCDSTFISTHGISYSSVVGRVRAYQQGGLDGIYNNNGGSPSIDSFYVDGVSITYGVPRQHIWTYIGGQGEGHAYWEDCPCNSGSNEVLLSFVGNDYYCESGTYAPSSYVFYPKDPIWDGKGCDFLESTCCTNPNLPWFYKQLNANVTENIELRVCSSEGYPDEVTAIDQIEIYVQ